MSSSTEIIDQSQLAALLNMPFCDKVTLFSKESENRFSVKNKVDVVCVDLAAADGTLYIAPQPHRPNCLRLISLYAITTSPLALASKKDYDAQETVSSTDRYWHR